VPRGQPDPHRSESERLQSAASGLGARSEAFDAADAASLERFFRDLPAIDHVMVTAGRPYYARLTDMDFAEVSRVIDEHLMLVLRIARSSTGKVRPGGTLLFMGGTGGRRPAVGLGLTSALTAALPALVANLALEIAPVRVNLIAPGFVDTPLSASLLGDEVEKRRKRLRDTLPSGAWSNPRTSPRSPFT